MNRLSVVVFCLLTALLSTTFAKGKKESPADHAYRILEVNAVSITVSFSKSGKDGAEHGTYSITGQTEVTIDGHPSNARNLRGGMVTHLLFSPDQKSVTRIEARDAPRNPERGHIG